MFVRCKMRRKDGKEHRYWSVVENVRVRGGRVGSARCSTSGRPTTVSARRGAARLRCWTRRRARALLGRATPSLPRREAAILSS